jgi:hypothetical protein
MMDQLASVGVEFDMPTLDRIFERHQKYYRDLTPDKKAIPWAMEPLYSNNKPIRPWSLTALKSASSPIYALAGKIVRTPGLYKQVDSKTDVAKKDFLTDTNERIHSSIRIRLACKGLGLNDAGIWDCPSLLKNWRLVKTKTEYSDPIVKHPSWEPRDEDQEMDDDGSSSEPERWVWEYCGPEKDAPTVKAGRILVEEPLGPYERYYLKLAGGKPNVYHFAHERDGFTGK